MRSAANRPSAERLRELLNYDRETGRLTWSVRAGQLGRVCAGAEVGCIVGRGYRKVSVDGVQMDAARVVWCWMTGKYPLGQVRHLDGVSGNNAWANLRDGGDVENRQPPTQARLRELMAYDAQTGRLVWKKVPLKNRVKPGDEVGNINQAVGGYRETRVDGVRLRVHRLIWCWMTGSYPMALIDHIDGDPANNAWANLREASVQINQENVEKARSDSRTGRRGVVTHPRTKKFGAKIHSHGRDFWLGWHLSPDEAEAAYRRAKAVLHAGWVPRDPAALRERLQITAPDRTSP